MLTGCESERLAAAAWPRALDVPLSGGSWRGIAGSTLDLFATPEKFAVLPVAWDNGAGVTTVDWAPEFY